MSRELFPEIFIFKNCFDSIGDKSNSILVSKLELIKKNISINVPSLTGKEINLIIVDSKAIQELNNNFRQIDQPTDVLSFPIKGEVWGEIWISPTQILNQSEALGETFEVELLRIVIHGLLHLADFDHKENYSDGSEEEMYILQEKILADILNS